MNLPSAPLAPSRGRHRSLVGQRALVTGASSGVGAAVTRALVAAGARVLATARRAERLEAMSAELPALVVEPGDLVDAAFRRRLVTVAHDRLGGLDLVVAAAGSGAVGWFGDEDPATLARVMAVNFTAPAELVRAALPLLRAGHDPAIVLVGSILGLHPLPLHAAYCASKAALRSLAAALRVELAADGIGVMLASLGPTESEFWDRLLVGARPEWSRGRQMSAAAAIVTGLRRRRREVLPGWRAKGFALAARLVPGLIDRVTAGRMRRSRTGTETTGT